MNVLFYRKLKNMDKLEESAKSILAIRNLQNYYPIYKLFFKGNEKTFNKIQFDTPWLIGLFGNHIEEDDRVYNVNLISNTGEVKNKQIYIKITPIYDPFLVLTGKYIHESTIHKIDIDPKNFLTYIKNDESVQSLEQLPNSQRMEENVLYSINNYSYVESFFVYLTSLLLSKYNVVHGLEYFGTFLGIKDNYKLNITSDINNLNQSPFFINTSSILYDNCNNLQVTSTEIQLSTPKSNRSLQNIIKIDDDNNNDNKNNDKDNDNDQNMDDENIKLFELTEQNLQFTDVMNYVELKQNNTNSNTNSLVSNNSKNTGSSSSRSSYTYDENEQSENDSSSNWSTEEHDEHEILSNSSENISIKQTWISIKHMPVTIIGMERCDITFAKYLLTCEIEENEILSILFQTIMILIIYQKSFHFTHNDLHIDNIMLISTDIKYIIYEYEEKQYKCPTYGKIVKIIDFGRSIYMYQSKFFSNNCYDESGEASSQYNFPPYYNTKKPLVEPNYSFDLCRLGCSLFDIFYLDESIDFPLVKQIILNWCMDDNGKNIYCKSNGDERYEEFKLYKMIARKVHHHIPSNELHFFERYLISKYEYKDDNENDENVCKININEIPDLS